MTDDLVYWVSRYDIKACTPPAEIPLCSAHGWNRAPGSKSSFHIHPRAHHNANGNPQVAIARGTSLLRKMSKNPTWRSDVKCRVRHQDVGFVRCTKPHPSLMQLHNLNMYRWQNRRMRIQIRRRMQLKIDTIFVNIFKLVRFRTKLVSILESLVTWFVFT